MCFSNLFGCRSDRDAVRNVDLEHLHGAGDTTGLEIVHGGRALFD
jgi:hypothetical protein